MEKELSDARQQIAIQKFERAERATELLIANEELTLQIKEKEKLAAALRIANELLLFENQERERRALELVIANEELAFQNVEKEKRAAQLHSAYKQLEAFNHITSHDLQEPLRKLQMFVSRMLLDEEQQLSEKSQGHLNRISEAALHMQTLIIDLRTYSVASADTGAHKNTDVMEIIHGVLGVFAATIRAAGAEVTVTGEGHACVIAFQFQQLVHQLVDNAIKFTRAGVPPKITIHSSMLQPGATPTTLLANVQYCHVSISDNGIGFDPAYKDQVFDIFKRLHERQAFDGTGIGLAIAKKITENHKGLITATAALNKGARFDIYIPVDSGSSACS